MREAEVKRETKETSIYVKLNLDGTGKNDIDTGVGFLNHMLTLVAVHGQFDLTVKAKGDLDVDCHHTVEDVGITFGDALTQALGDKVGIHRYGSFLLPMDEALAEIVLDLSGRPYLVWNADIPRNMLGTFDTEMGEDFFRAIAVHSGMTLHVNLPYGKNTHHMLEAIFKGFGRALSEAVAIDPRVHGIMSSKGSL
ncbi:MAG: imidazoleglycerol-phosphate dehydratase HisB [Acidaminococcus sp.]|jgi:imidazoleglycerol-phosphate dehydratase|nr:imidazoleglycerol-phosphate dehydratase HisB [Acidaminococcus sp.]MCI2116428.1 imidazoleglycerol-phosphate dehydratase HisB [Acidaminococcus sp.]